MNLFFASRIDESTFNLGEEESWHCIKVLRLGEGAPIHFTDGLGSLYEGHLVKAHPKGCLAAVDLVKPQPPRAWRTHIAIAPTKNIERFEWFLEKATEIGIEEITPLFCARSERQVLKLPRLEKVITAAVKQSLQAWKPVLNEPVRFTDFMKKSHPGQHFIAWCETGVENELHSVYRPGSDVTILIGPEGDFSKDEVALAMESGFVPVSLGKNRLRTETAGIVACHTIALVNRRDKDIIFCLPAL